GIVRAAIGECNDAGARKRKSAASAGARSRSEMIGNFLECAVDGIETNFGVALIVVTKEDSTVVGGPLRILDVAVEFVGDGVRIGAVAIHEVKLGGLMTLIAVVITGVGDEL